MGAPVSCGEPDGTHLGLVDGAARAVGGEDGGMAGFDCLLEAEQAFASAARAGAAHGSVAEEIEGAGDEFAVEALADDDGCAGATEVKGAGQNALVPEAVDLGSCSGAEREAALRLLRR